MPIFIVCGYAAILVVGVIISGVLSYYGLEKTAGEITILLVTLLMMIILVMDVVISYFRSTGKNFVFPLFIWCCAAFFSISSNFNHLYSNFMNDDVLAQTVATQTAVFRDNLVVTRGVLEGLQPITQAVARRTELKVELENLKAQINDPLRPGCGPECRLHMENIVRIIGRNVTEIAIPGIGTELSNVNEWFVRYRSQAESILDETLHPTGVRRIEILISKINSLLLKYPDPQWVMAEGGLSTLSEMSAASREVEREANEILPEKDWVTHDIIDPHSGRLGEIVYAFQNGFGEMPNPTATAVSLLLASVVDILPLLLSFALFGPGRLDRSGGNRKRIRRDHGEVISG